MSGQGSLSKAEADRQSRRRIALKLPAPRPMIPAGTSWLDYARCKDRTAVFFPELEDMPSAKAHKRKQAEMLCLGCVVRGHCEDYILSIPQDHVTRWGATWAGRNGNELRAWLKQKQRERQREMRESA